MVYKSRFFINFNKIKQIQKMPIDINLLRTEKGGKPDDVRKSQKNRWADEKLVDEVIDLDEQWRKSNYKMETLKMEFG